MKLLAKSSSDFMVVIIDGVGSMFSWGIEILSKSTPQESRNAQLTVNPR
jgi:hypothetical protein